MKGVAEWMQRKGRIGRADLVAPAVAASRESPVKSRTRQSLNMVSGMGCRNAANQTDGSPTVRYQSKFRCAC